MCEFFLADMLHIPLAKYFNKNLHHTSSYLVYNNMIYIIPNVLRTNQLLGEILLKLLKIKMYLAIKIF